MMLTETEFAYSTTLKPEKAVKFFKQKGLKVTYNWKDMDARAHLKAFTIAGEANEDILKEFQSQLNKSLKDGTTYDTFKKNIKKSFPTYVEGRLKTIHQTNLQNAYAVGNWQRLVENADNRPYAIYEAVLDGSTRDSHAALHGVIKKITDPFWNVNAPPNGFNCRCRLRSLTEEKAKKRGIKEPPKDFKPDEGWDINVGGEYGVKEDVKRISNNVVNYFKKKMTKKLLQQVNIQNKVNSDVTAHFKTNSFGAPTYNQIKKAIKDTNKMKIMAMTFTDKDGFTYIYDFSGVDIKKIKAMYILFSKEMNNSHDIWRLIADRMNIRYNRVRLED